MSATATAQDAVYQTLTDESYLNAFQTDPEAALEGYDLTAEETEALTSGDDLTVKTVAGDEGDVNRADVSVTIIVRIR
ncbi:Os1348 family NHLP clan protein [Halovivax cerinus]|uniref:Os1348 family NHLP clan protein n=1 Tax=Halovivax cerinus TaxID=1487865 RepID=A0ABD5NMY0_9EURY|nr:Os1348 family NHLP clan protein [Halovivax cerinus]